MEIEQPLILDWYNDKYAHIQVESLLYECVIEDKWLESIEVWIHEFIEMPLFKQSLFRVRNIRFSIDGDICITTIAHLLASFTGGSSIYGRPISVEEFDHHLLANCEVSQQRWSKERE